MKKVKVDCTPNPDKVIQVEIPDGSRWIHGDKTETEEINGKKYRIIKVMKDGKQIGVIDRMSGKFQYTDEAAIEKIIEKNENASTTDEVEKSFCVDEESKATSTNNISCCCAEPPYRQKSITEEEVREICVCKPVGPLPPVEVKEGKIKSFFKRIFRIK